MAHTPIEDDSAGNSPITTPEEEVIMDETEEQGSDEEMDEDENEEDLVVSADKVEIIAGAHSDQTAMTFAFKEEDHTLGNSLRHMINKNPEVDLCGYSIPHPSEAKMHLRIQTTENTTAIDALKKGMDDLYDLCAHIRQTYEQELAKGDFERVDASGDSKMV
ncbi:DNA-directed RNA polymerase [Radiomyces spectabilis]|uniref:DNA-directed RNA polymerase n=1 Tax=Radiomyces spectabilis TaxID=64574 RepID=UPI00221E47DE|nr:DNA-directed RNA polymerase [Radiomyces spectabilis]KAI8376549.1 DNA-directed RNA polymerase [Radiomyces spectabilis]